MKRITNKEVVHITPKTIMFIFGTRPEAIKMSPVIKELIKYPEWFNVKVIVTGQHKEQIVQVLNYFNIQSDINLNLMDENQKHSSIVC